MNQPQPQPDVIYQVTLLSGMVVTSPHEFGLPPHEMSGTTGPIVTLDGRVLVPRPAVPAEQPEHDSTVTA